MYDDTTPLANPHDIHLPDSYFSKFWAASLVPYIGSASLPHMLLHPYLGSSSGNSTNMSLVAWALNYALLTTANIILISREADLR